MQIEFAKEIINEFASFLKLNTYDNKLLNNLLKAVLIYSENVIGYPLIEREFTEKIRVKSHVVHTRKYLKKVIILKQNGLENRSFSMMNDKIIIKNNICDEVELTYIAGRFTFLNIPEHLKAALFMHAASLYESTYIAELPKFTEVVLTQFKEMEI